MKKKLIIVSLSIILIFSCLCFSGSGMAFAQTTEKAIDYSEMSIMEMKESVLRVSKEYLDENTELKKIENIQELKTLLQTSKDLTDLEIGKELLLGMEYDAELIETLPEATILDALNYSEHHIRSETVTYEDYINNEITEEELSKMKEASRTDFDALDMDSELSHNEAISGPQNAIGGSQSATVSSITFKTTYSYDNINRRIKHSAYYDCKNANLAYFTYVDGGIIMRTRGRQFISIVNSRNAKSSNLNNNPDYCFGVMNYWCTDEGYALFSGGRYDNSGWRTVYSYSPQLNNVYSTTFSFYLPGDDINVNSILSWWDYSNSDFSFYMQYYTVHSRGINSSQIAVYQNASYIRPTTSITGLGVDIGLGSGGGSLGISLQVSNSFQKIEPANPQEILI